MLIGKTFSWKNGQSPLIQIDDGVEARTAVVSGFLLSDLKEVNTISAVVDAQYESRAYSVITRVNEELQKDTCRECKRKMELMPIAEISFFATNTFLGKLSSKGNAVTFKSGKGVLLNLEFSDEASTIRAVAFNDVCRRLDRELIRGASYQVSRYGIKEIDPRFNNTDHKYELILENRTKIEFAEMCFTYINEAVHRSNIQGVVIQVKDEIEYIRNSNKCFKRNIVVVDSTGKLDITVFGKLLLNVGEIVEITCVNMKSWNGTPTTTASSSAIAVSHPSAPHAIHIHNWFKELSAEEWKSMVNECGAVSSLRDAPLGITFSSRCYITSMTQDGSNQLPYYVSCSACNRKLIYPDENLMSVCENCGTDRKQKGELKWLWNVLCSDDSGTVKATIFDQNARKIAQSCTQDFIDEQKKMESIHLTKRWMFEFLRKEDADGEKIVCESVSPLNFVNEGAKLLSDIKNMLVPSI